MPPRSAKKTAGPRKTAARTPRATSKAQTEAEVVEEPVEAEQVPEPIVVVKEEVKAKEIAVRDKQFDLNSSEIGLDSVEAEYEEVVKVGYLEEDNGERLELEDNEAEYEHDEDAAVDYDEKYVENEVQEDYIDEGEGDVIEEDEIDMVDEEIVDDRDHLEVEEDENVEGEHRINAEEEEQHKVVEEHRKRKEFEIFVGGLDKDANEDDLKKVFSQVGEITEVRLMMNPVTMKNKGFAFLRFATMEQAKRAVSELKSPVVRGKQCGVAPSQDSDTLFVGNICKSWTKEHFKEKLKSYGVENVEDVTLVEDTNNAGMNRGFAFLEFSSRTEAMDAYKFLQKRDVVFGVDRTAKIAFADSFIDPDDEIMAQVRTVFIDGLPAMWDEDRVRNCLKKYGVIEKVELARNMPAAKRNDFGFVTFDTHDNAVSCADGINNTNLGEGQNKVKIRARLSRPHQRGRVKRSLHGSFKSSRDFPRSGHVSYHQPPPTRFSSYAYRPVGARGVPSGSRSMKKPLGYRDRHPEMIVAERVRRLPPPERSYQRRLPAPVDPYPRISNRRDYGRRDDLPPPRSRAVPEYGSRVPIERVPSYKDDYSFQESGYSELPPRSASRPSDRRVYIDEEYERKLDRPLPTYREGRGRDYVSVSGSKRPYSEMDDPRYADVSIRQSRARLDYSVSGSGAQYGHAYSDRIGQEHVGYGSTRGSLSGHDSLYGTRQGITYARGSTSSSAGGAYSSSFSGGYLSRGSDGGGGSASSSFMPGRSLSSRGYAGSGGSGSYY
ncbi:heterogeneous nuclear ribonucleoprotein Q-like [Zingiber officinale]|uniref:RRM domain-containing protein n=1 Tax=Zingiber officinale TaxID=94328 RepID=A0A8J5G704_ZINOF|nr:heterogeneous nuclear ribonucleoprotein Q-like [Zingiber officinale]XP_042412493.1 heterogeneous nuclear ribonucleoprotein Q-like [Zingiber officinale]XP_042412494.1 heterogeneous nuclear ribonucleoprotein Q-like [Zingiber officinale]XP_042412495.1 heterogeneous nuclear ribonucleoprotein Q-like [Zingiber officinale]KAG6492970.1 hypothetical protein ZIOFF_047941 [Zingiber officinale]